MVYQSVKEVVDAVIAWYDEQVRTYGHFPCCVGTTDFAINSWEECREVLMLPLGSFPCANAAIAFAAKEKLIHIHEGFKDCLCGQKENGSILFAARTA
jgi:hypothetical protein